MSRSTLDSTHICLRKNFTISPQKNEKQHFIISPHQNGKNNFTLSPSQNGKQNFTISSSQNGKEYFTISPQQNEKEKLQHDPDVDPSLSYLSSDKRNAIKRRSVVNTGKMTHQTHHRATIMIHPTTTITDTNDVRGKATEKMIR